MGTDNLLRELQDICSSDPSRAAGTISAYMQMAQAHGTHCLDPAAPPVWQCQYGSVVLGWLCPLLMPEQSAAS